MPGLLRRSPLKGLGRNRSTSPFRVALPVIPSRSEESPPRTPNVVLREPCERRFAAAQHDRGVSLPQPANGHTFSPFSGLRLRSPGIYPRAGSGRQPVRDPTTRLPGQGRGGNPFGIRRPVSPGRVGAATRSGSDDPFPRARSGRQPVRDSTIRSAGRGGLSGRSPACDTAPPGGRGVKSTFGVTRPVPLCEPSAANPLRFMRTVD